MLRELVVDDEAAGRPIEEATKLAIVRLDMAAEGLVRLDTAAEGLDAVQRMVPSIAATIFIVELVLILKRKI